MQWLQSKTHPENVLLLGETENDVKTIKMLNGYALVFGMYQIWYRTPEMTGADRPEIKELLKAFPNATSVAWLTRVTGFADKGIDYARKEGELFG